MVTMMGVVLITFPVLDSDEERLQNVSNMFSAQILKAGLFWSLSDIVDYLPDVT